MVCNDVTTPNLIVWRDRFSQKPERGNAPQATQFEESINARYARTREQDPNIHLSNIVKQLQGTLRGVDALTHVLAEDTATCPSRDPLAGSQ